MSSGFKRKRIVYLVVFLAILVIITTLIVLCIRNSGNEASDNSNTSNNETTTEPESSSGSATDDKSLVETTEPDIDNNIYIIVEDNSANPGDKNVEVNILFKNNPGIFGMDFDLYYDESVMTLTDTVSFIDTESCVFTQPKKYHTPSSFLWDFQDDVWDKDGVFMKLFFDISETAQSGEYIVGVIFLIRILTRLLFM